MSRILEVIKGNIFYGAVILGSIIVQISQTHSVKLTTNPGISTGVDYLN